MANDGKVGSSKKGYEETDLLYKFKKKDNERRKKVFLRY